MNSSQSKWKLLATDFDGTIATEGGVAPSTIQSLRALRSAGLRAMLVTGRELADFSKGGFDLSIFDLVVVENGASIYDPRSQEETVIAPPPDAALIEALKKKEVPLSIGRTIIATIEPYDKVVLETLRELELEFTIIFNKGAVMILPPAVNKASGMLPALDKLGLPPSSVIAVGDGENDHTMLKAAGLPVTVSNAVSSLKQDARWTTAGSCGAGVEELIAAWLGGELERY